MSFLDRVFADSRSFARLVVYGASALSGAVLVTSASYGRVFLSGRFYAIPEVDVGSLYLPPAAAVIGAALFAVHVGRRIRVQTLFLAGLGSSLIALAILIGTAFDDRTRFIYTALVVGGLFLGLGLGLTIPALSFYATSLDPIRPERSALRLNLLLALGILADPVIAFGLVNSPLWWILPALLALLVILAMTAAPMLSRRADSAYLPALSRRPHMAVNGYVLCVVGYAICCVFLVTWSQLNGVSTGGGHLASYSPYLGVFWAATVMLARVLFGLLDQLRVGRIGNLAPFFALAVMILLGLVAGRDAVAEIGIYLIAAVGCASFLPISARAGEEDLTVVAIVTAGGIAVLYQVALGWASASLGAMLRTGMSTPEVFAAVGLIGVAAASGAVHLEWRLAITPSTAPVTLPTESPRAP